MVKRELRKGVDAASSCLLRLSTVVRLWTVSDTHPAYYAGPGGAGGRSGDFAAVVAVPDPLLEEAGRSRIRRIMTSRLTATERKQWAKVRHTRVTPDLRIVEPALGTTDEILAILIKRLPHPQMSCDKLSWMPWLRDNGEYHGDDWALVERSDCVHRPVCKTKRCRTSRPGLG